MIDTMDETEVKKRILEQLQQEMSGRRASPLLSIDISAGGDDDDGPIDDVSDDMAIPEGGDGTNLEEPTNVKDRLGEMLRKRGMMD